MIFRFSIEDRAYGNKYRQCDQLRRLCKTERCDSDAACWFYYDTKIETLLEFLELTKAVGVKIDTNTLQRWLRLCLATISNPAQSDSYFQGVFHA